MLYIDLRGPYPKMAGQDWMSPGSFARMPRLDCYGLPDRDARAYDGPHPVVAHPPCGPWGRLRHLYKGAEHDCAPRAVEQVRRWGGVLEHPAGSKLWDVCGLPAPLRNGPNAQYGLRDAFDGFSIELDQCDWGHVARKRTWLYLVRVPRSALEAPPFPGREPTHWTSGSCGASSRTGKPVPPGIKVCSAQQRRRTPPLFAEYLIRLARAVRS